MKITKDLPQFIGPPALLLVAGRQIGIIYLVHIGEIRLLSQVEIPNPEHTEREEYSHSIGQDKQSGLGGVYENKKRYVQEKFLKELVADLEMAVRRYRPAIIYLFCPAYSKTALLEAIPKKARRLIGFSLEGNYLNEHVFGLLEHIQNEIERISQARPIASEEAKMLLRLRETIV